MSNLVENLEFFGASCILSVNVAVFKFASRFLEENFMQCCDDNLVTF